MFWGKNTTFLRTDLRHKQEYKKKNSKELHFLVHASYMRLVYKVYSRKKSLRQRVRYKNCAARWTPGRLLNIFQKYSLSYPNRPKILFSLPSFLPPSFLTFLTFLLLSSSRHSFLKIVLKLICKNWEIAFNFVSEIPFKMTGPKILHRLQFYIGNALTWNHLQFYIRIPFKFTFRLINKNSTYRVFLKLIWSDPNFMRF